MTSSSGARRSSHSFHRIRWATALTLIGLFGIYLRFDGLGVRSLWRDELCTWHVSRMPLGESLRWGPELTKPPLYQFALRLLTNDRHPSERMLRLPAAVCGLLVLVVGWWMGKTVSGWPVGLALAGLLACNELQVYYSREARPYSMLVLGCALSVLLWYRLVTTRRRMYLLPYVVTTVLTLYAHYLAVLTVFAEVLWWLVLSWRSSRTGGTDAGDARRPARAPDQAGRRSARGSVPFNELECPARDRGTIRLVAALVTTALLCIPLAARYLYYRTAMFQGLEWIPPPTWRTALTVLGQLTFGVRWVLALLIPAVALWIAGVFGASPKRLRNPGGPLFAGRTDICGLLLLWWFCAWFGLFGISWVAHPAMVARYALPAALPALLFPLLVAHRVDRRAPLIVMAVFGVASAPDWLDRRVPPGLREMARYLREHVDRDREAVVLTIDNTVYPGWEESERLGFRYYPIPGVSVEELYLERDGVTARNEVLNDPRGLYLVVLWADEVAIVEAAGRRAVPFTVEGRELSRLLFEPYRLVHVAPLSTRGGKG